MPITVETTHTEIKRIRKLMDNPLSLPPDFSTTHYLINISEI